MARERLEITYRIHVVGDDDDLRDWQLSAIVRRLRRATELSAGSRFVEVRDLPS
jgi:hypothetical protein